MINTFLPQNI